MNAVTFDTLKYIKTLESAGFSRQQAEAQVTAERDALNEIFSTQKETSATKEEITTFKSEFKGDFKTLESSVDAKIANAKLEIVKWLIGSIAASTIAIITAIIKIMH